jgi:excisionase family DNA binding protein
MGADTQGPANHPIASGEETSLAPMGGADSPFLDALGVAKLLAVSVHTVWDWRKNGELPPAYLFGRSVRWKRKEILLWAEERRERRSLNSRPAVAIKDLATFHTGRKHE